MKMTRLPFLIATVVIVSACATPKSGVEERLDPETAATVTYANVPLVFYDDRSGMAAYARDFVNVGPLEVNQMGNYRYYLWLGIWSTAQILDDSDQRDGFETIYLFVDGEPFKLDAEVWSGNPIGISQSPYIKPVSTAAEAYYPVTIDQIRLIAEASSLRLRTSGTDSGSYELWDDQNSASQSIKRFLEYVN
jgi:hypothetical protein